MMMKTSQFPRQKLRQGIFFQNHTIDHTGNTLAAAISENIQNSESKSKSY